MRCVLQVTIPVEKFNRAVADGTAGETIQQILENTQPEAVYFTTMGGDRGAYIVVDLESASDIPRHAEPWFLKFDAKVDIHPCMLPDDLAAAGLEDLGAKWA